MTNTHWDEVYRGKGESDLSWYETAPTQSLAMLQRAGGIGSVLDVGAGRSMLADHLLAAGREVTVLDLTDEAFSSVRVRLDAVRLPQPTYIVADVTAWIPDHQFQVWHDRAVFHFLTERSQQDAYAARAADAVATGGALVLGAFAPDGPRSCSNLPTSRHSISDLVSIFEPRFELEHGERHVHVTPWDAPQPFSWVVMRRIEPSR